MSSSNFEYHIKTKSIDARAVLLKSGANFTLFRDEDGRIKIVPTADVELIEFQRNDRARLPVAQPLIKP